MERKQLVAFLACFALLPSPQSQEQDHEIKADPKLTLERVASVTKKHFKNCTDPKPEQMEVRCEGFTVTVRPSLAGSFVDVVLHQTGKQPNPQLDTSAANLLSYEITSNVRDYFEAQKSLLTSEDFVWLKSNLAGRNVRAKMTIPAWVKPNGDLIFAPGVQLRPGEVGTIGAVALCNDYPPTITHPLQDDPCGPNVPRSIFVLVVNGSQLRPVFDAQNDPSGRDYSRNHDVTKDSPDIAIDLDVMEKERKLRSPDTVPREYLLFYLERFVRPQ